jgi:hypothetical protein
MTNELIRQKYQLCFTHETPSQILTSEFFSFLSLDQHLEEDDGDRKGWWRRPWP